MSTIKINYSKANEVVKNLDSVKTYLNNSNNNCNKAINAINSYWKGNSASAMIDKLSQFKTKTSNISGNIQSSSAKFNKAVKEIKAAEERTKKSIGNIINVSGGSGSAGSR